MYMYLEGRGSKSGRAFVLPKYPYPLEVNQLIEFSPPPTLHSAIIMQLLSSLNS